ncbi:putative porin [Paraburkholderia jirisanensis]
MIQKMVIRGEQRAGRSLRRSRISCAALAALGIALASQAQAQSLETQAAQGTAAPTESVVVNLINLLVKRGVLTQANAQDLITQAQTEAVQAKKAAGARPPVPVVANAPTQPGDVAVPYVPQMVRDQIRDQVKQEVIAQAKSENWAQPNTFPDWVSRITINGDMRVRDEFHFFSPRNAPGVTDFAAINRNGPFDFNPNTNSTFPPTLNTTQDRSNLFSIRARLGVTAQVSDQLSAGVQLATGNDDSPVSTTGLLGGGLAKKSIWLNQGYIRYTPTSWVNITAGRFDNPFFSSDLLYDPDLEFDGIAANFRKALPAAPDITLFGTLGAFPVQYSNDEFPSDNPQKSGSDTKWMFGGQFGAEWKINEQNRLKGAIAYYDFQNSRGEQSAPCALFLGSTSCSTDNDAPAFMQKGNTLIALRNIVQDPSQPPGFTPDPQLFGLAYNYRIFDAKLQWDTKIADTFKLRLDGEFVRNLAYDENKAFNAPATPVNNFNNANPSATTVTQADYRSGGNGFLFKATLGEPQTHEKGQWNFSVAYKYLQPDAVLDAFTDSDFHLGGTNAKGYVIAAEYAVARDAWVSARYLSAREVYGPPQSIDVLQLELNARF